MALEYRLGTIEDVSAIVSLIHDAIEEMEGHGIYQWDEIYPIADDFEADIISKNLYVVVDDERIAAIYVISNESDEAYNNVDWKCPNESSYILHRYCV